MLLDTAQRAPRALLAAATACLLGAAASVCVAQPANLTVGYAAGEPAGMQPILAQMRASIAKRTGGRVQIVLIRMPAASMLAGLRNGSLNAIAFSEFQNIAPVLSVGGLPGAWRGVADYEVALERGLAQRWASALEPRDLILIAGGVIPLAPALYARDAIAQGFRGQRVIACTPGDRALLAGLQAEVLDCRDRNGAVAQLAAPQVAALVWPFESRGPLVPSLKRYRWPHGSVMGWSLVSDTRAWRSRFAEAERKRLEDAFVEFSREALQLARGQESRLREAVRSQQSELPAALATEIEHSQAKRLVALDWMNRAQSAAGTAVTTHAAMEVLQAGAPVLARPLFAKANGKPAQPKPAPLPPVAAIPPPPPPPVAKPSPKIAQPPQPMVKPVPKAGPPPVVMAKPAPKAAPPPAAAGPEPARRLEDHLIWNTFAEEFGERYWPARSLKPKTSYTIRAHLAALSYGKNEAGVYEKAASRSTRKVAREWLNTKKQEEELTVVLLYDSRYFREPDAREKRVKVRIDRMRDFDNGKVALPQEPLAQLRKDDAAAPFVFVPIEFKIATQDKLPAGAAPIAISIWYGDTPVDEISVAFCVEGTACDGPQGVQFGIGLDSARVAAGPPTSKIAAAIHLIDLQGDVGAVFRSFDPKTGMPDALETWTLDKSASMVVQDLKSIMAQLGKAIDDKGIRAEGEALYGTLFPKSASDASDAFSAFLRARIAGRKPLDGSDMPTIFVRPRFADAQPPALLPFGLLAVRVDNANTVLLGQYFRIEGPLKLQSYGGVSGCVSSWKMIGPPPTGDAALEAARKRLVIERHDGKPTFVTAGGPVPIVEDMQEFLDWVRGGESAQGTLLSILSHHESNHVRFAGDPRVHAAVIRRTFAQPSVALLNGCSTGQPGLGATNFLEVLNEQGFQGAIATMTEVSGTLAGDFLDCFARQVGQSPAGITLGRAYSGALRCTAIDRNHGAKSLWYVLLGDSEIKICAPRP